MNKKVENLKINTDANKTEANSTNGKKVQEHKEVHEDKNVLEDKNVPVCKNAQEDNNVLEVKNLPDDKKVQDGKRVLEEKQLPGDKNVLEDKHAPENKKVQEVRNVQEVKNLPDDKKVQNDENGLEEKQLPGDKNVLEDKHAPEDKKVQEVRNVQEVKNLPDDKKVQHDKNGLEEKQLPGDNNVLDDKHAPEDKKVQEVRNIQEVRNVQEVKNLPDDKKVQHDQNGLEEKQLPGDKNMLEDKHVPEDKNVLEQEIEKNEPKKGIVFESKKVKAKKFLNLFKHILQSLKGYSIKRKSRIEAKRIEKEKLKTIPKEVPIAKNKSEEQEWIIKQCKKYFKVPLYEPNPKYVFKTFKIKAMSRYVPEEKLFRIRQTPKPKDSIYLSWNGPPLKHCMCPCRECFCRGDSNLKWQKLPWQLRFDVNPFYFFQTMFNFPKFKTNTQLINDLVAMLAAEENRYKKMSKGDLARMAPEICLLRCKHFFKAGENRHIRYLPIEFKDRLKGLVDDKKFKTSGDVEESQKPEEIEETKKSEDVEESENSEDVKKSKKIEDVEEAKKSEDEVDNNSTRKQDMKKEEDIRICNAFFCKVTTQTDTGPDGMLNIGKYSHVMFGSIKDTILSDIDGQKLHISPFEIESPACYNQKTGNVNVKNLRSRLSKFISSIVEIKEPGVPIATRSTQLPSCNKICDKFRDVKYKRSRYGLGTPCVIKDDESLHDEINTVGDVKDQSSCVCCKAYKESFNGNVENNINEVQFKNDSVKQSSYKRYKERVSPARHNQVSNRKMGNLFSLSGLRSRFFKLISSILEMKEPGVPTATKYRNVLDTPCEYKDKSYIKEGNTVSDIEDPSSCTCCKPCK